MRRPALLGAAWIVAAAAAVGLGFLAVSLVDASASPGASLVAGTASPTATGGGSSPAPSSAASAPATTQRATVGGTVYAHCTGGAAVLAGVPAAGWSTDDSTKPGQMEFRNGSQKVEVRAACTNGSPSFVVDGPAGSGSTTSSSSAVVSTQSPPTDDKGGLKGGHGADDSSGRHGGHG